MSHISHISLSEMDEAYRPFIDEHTLGVIKYDVDDNMYNYPCIVKQSASGQEVIFEWPTPEKENQWVDIHPDVLTTFFISAGTNKLNLPDESFGAVGIVEMSRPNKQTE